MRRTLLLIPLLVVGLAGCAGDPRSPSVATAGGATPSPSAGSADSGGGGEADPVEFAKCMRANGIPEFPDPETSDKRRFSVTIPDGTPKETVDKAMEACRAFMPNGGRPGRVDPAITAKLRELSRCMRANGVPDFPDPSADGGIQLRREKDGSGIDPESAAFKKAEEACKKFRPEPRERDGGA
jgi:hypothetical protein